MRAMNTTIAIICCVAAFIVGAAAAGFICFKQGIAYRQKQAESIMGSAEKEAERLLADADKEAETKKKAAASLQPAHTKSAPPPASSASASP